MSAASAPEPLGAERSGTDDTTDLLRLCHDLRQYVAAGLLLSGTTPGSAADMAARMNLIQQQFAAIEELLDSESAGTSRGGAVNLTRLVSECAEVVRLTHRVPVVTEHSSRVLVHGEQALLRRAVGNMLDNACRAAGLAGRVLVTVDVTADEARVEVADNGAGFGGISSGTGHGLQAVAAAARSCHGRLEISSGPGPGTTVRLCLPAGRHAVRPA